MVSGAIREVRLERVALSVPDLDDSIARWETLLGVGFDVMTVTQPSGDVRVAIHPAGIELVEVTDGATALRSFHLAVPSVDEVSPGLDALGWPATPGPVVAGRRHSFVDAEGVRLVLVEEGRS